MIVLHLHNTALLDNIYIKKLYVNFELSSNCASREVDNVHKLYHYICVRGIRHNESSNKK